MDVRAPQGQEEQIGEVTHYWSHLGVAGVHLTAPVDVGEHIHIVGHTSNMELDVSEMEIDHQCVTHANAGDDVGIKVADHVREHDKVYRQADLTEIGAEGTVL